MSQKAILSAPEEPYLDHIGLVVGQWKGIKGRLLPTLCRLFIRDERLIERYILIMLALHDLGKLTSRWQTKIQSEHPEKIPTPHTPPAAAYIYYLFGPQFDQAELKDLLHAITFAILIHHIDRGIVCPTLERPDTLLIERGIIDYRTEKLRWHSEAEEIVEQTACLVDFSPKPISELTLSHIREVSFHLREWSRGGAFLQLHRRRLLASACHHILKLCDIRAAVKRVADSEGEELATHQKKLITDYVVKGGILYAEPGNTENRPY